VEIVDRLSACLKEGESGIVGLGGDVMDSHFQIYERSISYKSPRGASATGTVMSCKEGCIIDCTIKRDPFTRYTFFIVSLLYVIFFAIFFPAISDGVSQRESVVFTAFTGAAIASFIWWKTDANKLAKLLKDICEA
jgi:hypothetical protein